MGQYPLASSLPVIPMQVILANPRGFCAGVDRAIDIVERALTLFGQPIYVRHEVVHNKFVVEDLRNKGAVFVEELDEVPDGATVIFSAHGVARSVVQEAERRGLKVFDATCPLVTKVHMEVTRHARRGDEVILIGHAGHPEVDGTLGQYDRSKGGEMYLVETIEDAERIQIRNPDALAYVTQTTLSVDDTLGIIETLKRRFPNIQGQKRDDICYATQNRQDAVKALASQCDLFLVVGSPNSSNSNRLREIAEKLGVEAYLVDNAGQIEDQWLQGKTRVGVTAGASAPELLVHEVITHLKEAGVNTVREHGGKEEGITFSLPKALR